MPYSPEAAWIMEELSREGGGRLAQFDGKLVAANSDGVVAADSRADVLLRRLADADIGLGTVTFLRVRIGTLV